RAPAYRDRFELDALGRERLADPYTALLAAHAGLVAQAAADSAAAPAARDALDHVAATAETAARRALWLNATFDLPGARLLCVGDHDLSSLAVAALVPGLAVTVADVDERLLSFIESRAAERGHDIRCLYADFRFGLPEVAVESADLVLTDPPYTPEGVALFLGRGAQALRDRVNGRLVLAYGFSPLHPALGMKTQRAVQDLDLVTEALLPAFNRYHGAQAVGSASDLYVLRPTARTFQVLDRKLAGAAVRIYTHGAQSLEARAATLDPAVARAVVETATGGDGEPSLLAGEGWPVPAGGAAAGVATGGAVTGAAAAVGLAALFAAGVPAAAGRRAPVRVAVNLLGDPGPWLLRALLAVNADRLALLVPNNHPDLVSQEAQRALTGLVAPKYALCLRRSTPAPDYAVVEATAVPAAGGRVPAAPVAADLLSRAHGKTGNVWREALIRRGTGQAGGSLTKNEARALIAGAVSRPAWLDARLIDLPRHAIERLLAAAAAL
ncbi:MAG TPA: bis-aminopropyl spermidine synthase family protein, partial [Trebonia sp.]|nr:bis-aminopropyl spermidine synthase family protein [Trebonia sp.]